MAMAAMAADPLKPPVFQMRLVLDGPSDQSEPMDLPQKAGATSRETVHIQKKVLLDQTALQSAQVVLDEPSSGPRINIKFSDTGRKLFAEVTRENLHKRLAIIIDGQLHSAPIIHEEIAGGTATLSGNFTGKEAKELVAKIEKFLSK